ncbi:hypothetical protein H8E07_15930 [bacterium]|nr:hypothetical protein [bacterium]
MNHASEQVYLLFNEVSKLSSLEFLLSFLAATLFFILHSFTISHFYQMSSIRKARIMGHLLWGLVIVIPLAITLPWPLFDSLRMKALVAPGLLAYTGGMSNMAFEYYLIERKVVLVLSSFNNTVFRENIGKLLHTALNGCAAYAIETEESRQAYTTRTAIGMPWYMGAKAKRYIPKVREVSSQGSDWRTEFQYLADIAKLIVVDTSFDTPGLGYELKYIEDNTALQNKIMNIRSKKKSKSKQLSHLQQVIAPGTCDIVDRLRSWRPLEAVGLALCGLLVTITIFLFAL